MIFELPLNSAGIFEIHIRKNNRRHRVKTNTFYINDTTELNSAD